MIKTRSPYYLQNTWVVDTDFRIELYIWKGDKASVPVAPQYSIIKENPIDRVGDFKVNISNYINDFLDTEIVSNITTSINDSDSQVWVKSQTVTVVGGVDTGTINVSTDLAVRGYGYGIEGENTSTPANNVLAYGEEVKVSRQGVYVLPVLVSETVSTTIDVNSLSVSKPFIKTATTESSELVQLVWIDCSEYAVDEYIEIYLNGVLVSTLLMKDEFRYEPYDVFFANKEGQLQVVTFFKEKELSLRTNTEVYESSNGQPLNGKHQIREFNKNGNEGFSANSGFMSEDNNEIISQLMLSELIWLYKDSVFIPLNIASKNIVYQSRNKQRLLNYKIDFDYAFNKINDI